MADIQLATPQWPTSDQRYQQYQTDEFQPSAQPPSCVDVPSKQMVRLEKEDFDAMPDPEAFLAGFDQPPPITTWKNLTPIQTTKANPEHFIKFHDACQQRGVVVTWGDEEPTPYRFTAAAYFGDYAVHSEGTFPSKKLAKEDVCKRALAVVEQIDGSRKRKSFEPSHEGRVNTAELNSTNWIAILQNFTQATKIPMPDYSEFCTPQTPYLFASVVRLSNCPLSGFGFEEDLYSSRQLARKAAAREAVTWLRARGEVLKDTPITGGPPAPKRHKSVDVDLADPGVTGLTQALHDYDVNSMGGRSLPQQVHDLVASMGFSQPSWRHKPSQQFGPQSLDMAAIFTPIDVQKEPRLAGEIGKIEGIAGKKPAKEQCCRAVLRVLEDIKLSRSGH